MAQPPEGYIHLPGPLREAIEKFDARLAEAKDHHIATSLAALEDLGAPAQIIEAVAARGDVSQLSFRGDAAAPVLLKQYRLYKNIFASPLSRSVENMEGLDVDGLRVACTTWFGVEVLMAQIAEDHFNDQPLHVGSYDDWERQVLMPSLEKFLPQDISAPNYSYDQMTTLYYQHLLRPKAYAVGVGNQVLAKQLEGIYLDGGSITEEINQFHANSWLAAETKEILSGGSDPDVDQWARAFPFNEDFIRQVHGEFVEQ